MRASIEPGVVEKSRLVIAQKLLFIAQEMQE